MDLKTWLKDKGITYRAFSKTIKVHEFTIARIANGTCIPSTLTAARIEEATDNQVKLNDLIKKPPRAANSSV